MFRIQNFFYSIKANNFQAELIAYDDRCFERTAK